MYKIFVIFALYLPFQVALNPAEGIDLASIRVFILALFFAWLAAGFKRKKISIKNDIQTWLVGIFLFLNAISIIGAQNTNWSLRKLMFLFSIFPIYFAAVAVVNDRQKKERIVKALVFSGTAVAGLGIIQFLAQFIFGWEAVRAFWADYLAVPFLGKSFSAAVLANPSWLVGIGGRTYLRAFSIFPDPHMFSFYLCLLIPLALGLFWAKGQKWALAAAIVLLVANVLTFSRGGYGAALVGVAAGIIFVWKKMDKKGKGQAVAILGALILSFSIHSPASQRFQSSFDVEEGSNKGRIGIWEEALGVIKKNPLAGVGIGNYAVAVRPEAKYRDPIYAHNIYLDIAAETGIVNAAAWISLLFFSMRSFYKKGKEDNLFFFGAASLLAFSAQSLVDTAIYSPVVLTLLLLIISFSDNENEKNINA